MNGNNECDMLNGSDWTEHHARLSPRVSLEGLCNGADSPLG